MAPRRRPHHSNDLTFNSRLASIERSLKPAKTIYWTETRLRKLLPRVIQGELEREQWFAARVRSLASWPKRTTEEILEAGSRVNPARLMDGRWAWPASELAIQRKLAATAPEPTINVPALRRVLSGLDERQGERFLEMLVQQMPVPEGNPSGWDTRTLKKIRKAHARMTASLASDRDTWAREIDLTEGAQIPNPHPPSPMGWTVRE